MSYSRVAQFLGVSSWITTIMLIENCGAAAVNDDTTRECSILELYGNAGIDVGKFERFSFRKRREKEGRVVAVDGDAASLNQERKRWESKKQPYKSAFHSFDDYLALTIAGVTADTSENADGGHRLGSFDCAVSFHHGLERHFDSEHSARSFVQLVAHNLREGGVFMGTMVDLSSLFEEMVKSGRVDADAGRWSMDKGLFGVEIFSTSLSEFGTRYELNITGEQGNLFEKYLVHMPSLVRLCDEFGLELVHCTNFEEFYADYKHLYLEHLKAYNVFQRKEKNSTLEIEEGQWRLMRLHAVFMFRKRPTTSQSTVSENAQQQGTMPSL